MGSRRKLGFKAAPLKFAWGRRFRLPCQLGPTL